MGYRVIGSVLPAVFYAKRIAYGAAARGSKPISLAPRMALDELFNISMAS